MTDPLVRVLAGGPAVTVTTAVVDSVAADGTLTLRVGDGLLPAVARLRSYDDATPGDVVHVLSNGRGTTVVLGAEVSRAAGPAPAQPEPPTEVKPRLLATYDRVAQTWSVGSVAQTPMVLAGAMFYDTADLTDLFGRRPAGVEILLDIDDNAEPLGMVLISNVDAAGVFQPISPLHTVQAAPSGDWVRLPIAWLQPLVTGVAGGVGFISNTNTALSVSDGTLRVTPL